MNKIVLSKNMKLARKSAKKSQLNIACCLCVNRATVAKWETGRVIPSLGTIEKIAKLTGCKPFELLAGVFDD